MIKNLSVDFCIENKVVVLSNNEKSVLLGIVSDLDEDLSKRIKRYYSPEFTVEYKIITKDEYDVLITRLLSGTNQNFHKDIYQKKDDIINAANDAPIINLLNSILTEAIMNRASDIHIEIYENETRIRYRIDGKLETKLEIEKEKGLSITARIKILANLNILEHRRCQDGRFDFYRNNNVYDIRVSIIPGIEGESTVLRILGGNIQLPKLEELGFTVSQLKTIRKFMSVKHGLILVTGPTGSGKTTTLASILSELNQECIEIITVEDPVEYRLPGVLQISVNEEIGQTFFEILKRLLRHDPDILMIGEIRDEETAAMACRMALTGHLVFASIHTNSCEETPLRLVDMGVPAYIVSAVLKGVISQSLVEKKGGGRTVKADISFFEKEEDVKILCKK